MPVFRVIPIVRLPRQLGFFDYTAPDDLIDQLAPGTIVTIPFQKRVINGVIWDRINDAAAVQNLKQIIAIPPHALPVTLNLRAIAIHLATKYAVSLATAILFVATPIMKRAPRTIPPRQPAQSWLTELTNTPDNTPLPTSQTILVPYHSINQKISLYDRIAQTPGQHLFLCPTITDVTALAEYFAQKKLSVAILHGELAAGHLVATHQAIRDEIVNVIVATRVGIFAEIPKLTTIIIDQSERPEHKQFDQNPRFDAREISAFRAKITPCKLVLTSCAPRIEDWHACHSGSLTLHHLPESPPPPTTLINLKDEIHYGNYSFISTALQDAIKQSLAENKSAFLFLNRKGASAVVCKSCDEIFTCTACNWPQRYFPSRRALVCPLCHAATPLPERCPHCGGQGYRSQGMGTEKIILQLRALFPNQKIISLEQTAEQTTPPMSWDGAIIVGTTYAVINHPELFSHISTLGIITADPVQNMENARSTETQWQNISAILSHAPALCAIIIQAFEPEHPFVQSIAHRNYAAFATTLLQERADFHLPPTNQILTLYHPPQPHSPRNTTAVTITASLDKTSILYNNITTKRGERGAPDRIMIQLPHSTPPLGTSHSAALTTWLASLPSDWLVDPDPLVF